jgi:hypothetical protein
VPFWSDLERRNYPKRRLSYSFYGGHSRIRTYDFHRVNRSCGKLLTEQWLKVGSNGKTGPIGGICHKNATKPMAPNRVGMGWFAGNRPSLAYFPSSDFTTVEYARAVMHQWN